MIYTYLKNPKCLRSNTEMGESIIVYVPFCEIVLLKYHYFRRRPTSIIEISNNFQELKIFVFLCWPFEITDFEFSLTIIK